MEGTNRGIPMTRRIAAEMEERIADGTLPAGSRLPSVRELAVRYGISTAVCLSAYRALEKKGLVERRAGSGTFVCGTPAAADPKNYFYSWGFRRSPPRPTIIIRTISTGSFRGIPAANRIRG